MSETIETKVALLEKQVEINTRIIEELKVEREERLKLSLEVSSLTSTVKELNHIIEGLKEHISNLEQKPGDLALKLWQYIGSLILSAGVGAIITTLVSMM